MSTTESRMYTVVLSSDKNQYARTHWNSIMLWPTKKMAYDWSRNTNNMYHFQIITDVIDRGLKIKRMRRPKPDELEVVEVTCTWR